MTASTRVKASELVEKLSLDDIRYIELAGSVDITSASAGSGKADVKLTLSPAIRDDPPGLIVIADAETTTEGATIRARLGATYSYPEPFTLDDDEMAEFLNRVAMINLTPYVREALADIAARLRVDMPVMPLITAGTVTRTTDSAATQSD